MRRTWLLASAGAAAAQEFRATVRGQVLDSSKGALPGATVTLTNTATNETATAVTNAEGSYTVPFLRPGSYTMTVELQGFQKYTRSGMVLQVNETATINVEMGVGGLTEQVSVTAESPLLETSNASRGTVIDSARIAELPLQERNLLLRGLPLLLPLLIHLGQLAMQVRVVQIKLADTPVEVLHLRSQRLRLLLKNVRRVGLRRRRLERPLFAAGADCRCS